MTYEYKCKKCEKVYLSKQKKSIYCSRICKDKDSIKLHKFTCQHCGQEIIRTGKQWTGIRKYCSITCSNAAQNIGKYRICQVCGESKHYSPYYDKRVKTPEIYVCKPCRRSGKAPKGYRCAPKQPNQISYCPTCGKTLKNNRLKYCSRKCVKSSYKFKVTTRIEGTQTPSITYISYKRML